MNWQEALLRIGGALILFLLGLTIGLLFIYWGTGRSRRKPVEGFQDAPPPPPSDKPAAVIELEKKLQPFCQIFETVKKSIRDSLQSEGDTPETLDKKLAEKLQKELPEGVPACPFDFDTAPNRALIQIQNALVYSNKLMEEQISNFKKSTSTEPSSAISEETSLVPATVEGFDGTLPECPFACVPKCGTATATPPPNPDAIQTANLLPQQIEELRLKKLTKIQETYAKFRGSQNFLGPAQPSWEKLLEKAQKNAAEIEKIKTESQSPNIPRPEVENTYLTKF